MFLLRIDKKYIPHIIGKEGKNIKQLIEANDLLDLKIQENRNYTDAELVARASHKKNVTKCFKMVDKLICTLEANWLRANLRKFRIRPNHSNKTVLKFPKPEDIKEMYTDRYEKKMHNRKKHSTHGCSRHAWQWKAKSRHAIWRLGTKSKIGKSKLSVKRENGFPGDKIDFEEYEMINAYDSFLWPRKWYYTRESADLKYEQCGVPEDGPFLVSK